MPLMRTAALVLALFGLNACSNAIVGGSFNSSAAVAAPASGTTVSVVGSSGAAAVAGALAFAAFMDAGNPGYMDMRAPPSFTGPYGWFWTRPVPELDPDRKISEQDCTKPLDLSQGNIRCK
jgi:hypothetical protein